MNVFGYLTLARTNVELSLIRWLLTSLKGDLNTCTETTQPQGEERVRLDLQNSSIEEARFACFLFVLLYQLLGNKRSHKKV